MVSLRRPLLATAMVAAGLVIVNAQGTGTRPITIKLATLAPKTSVWYNEMAQMASDWRKVSGGRIELTIFDSGTQGDEPDFVRKMQFNQLQAASVTAIGVAPIDPAFYAFTIPLFFDSPDELFCVMDRMTPTFEKRFEAKGFVLLSMGYAGWVQAFSRKPVTSLAEFKRMKVFTSTGDPKMVQWYKENGFNPVPLASTDMLASLQTGVVEAVPNTPLGMLTMQWYKQAPYMLDLGIAPLAGAQVITRRAWDSVPAEARPALLESAQGLWKRLRTKVPDADSRAVAAMEKNGLTVTRLKGTPAAGPFDDLAKRYATTMRGTWVPADIFDQTLKERDACRAASPRK